MVSRSSSLVILALVTSAIQASYPAVQASYPPFDLIDEYVNQFRVRLNDLNDLSEKYKHVPEEYHHEELEHEKEVHMLAEAEEYDFIIVGAGASGSVIASRLSEEPKWKVLLLEAGEAENSVTQVPSLHPQLVKSHYSWSYSTVPQNTTCLGSDEQKCIIRKGKAFGGDSVVNEMLFTRGHPLDYDTWADTGLKGWCWESLQPYFKKIEHACLKDMDKKYRHYGGPIQLENFHYATPLREHLLKATEEEYKHIDYNGKDRLGFGLPQVIARNGRRHSISKSYLDQAVDRKNLHLKLNSRVEKVIIGEHTKEAVGVKYIHEDKVFVAKAKKEIILAAGAINTPQILMLSGVGPGEDLTHLHIPIIADLKVGSHLQDHISINLNFHYKSTHDNCFYHINEDITNYLRQGEGPLTANGLELVGFIKTKKSKGKTEYPDIQLLVRRDHYKPGCNYWKSEDHAAEQHSCEGHNKLSIEVILLHPKSKGYLKLLDKNPFHQPLINPYGLSDEEEEDVDTLVEGIYEALKFTKSKALLHTELTLIKPELPLCQYEHNSHAYWSCAVRHLGVYRGDVVGTARMGVETDKYAVVDGELKVLGVHNLRVADASVIPVTLCGNVMAPEVVIGEKAASLIKHFWLN